MVTAVTILRCLALLAFAAPMLIRRASGHRTAADGSRERRASRTPFVANVAAWSLFGGVLIAGYGPTTGVTALLLASTGTIVAVCGAAIILWSRANLGEAWSFVPTAAEDSGFVITGPYRLVRHPIYLGLALLALGQGTAFSNGPALLVVLAAVVPSLLWRARVEEELLTGVFGERYVRYKARTAMIVPHLF